MATIDEQIKSLEEEISKTKYNKATQGHIGKLKAKIAALRERQEKAQATQIKWWCPDSKSRNPEMLQSLWLVFQVSENQV